MDIKSLLRTAVITGLIASVFIPLFGGANFIAGHFYFPFITPKNFAFRIIVELTLACWALYALKEPSARPRPLMILYAFGLFVASLGISALFAENPIKSFWSNFERMEGWVGLLHLGAYFLVLTSALRAEKIWQTFLNVSISVSVAVGLFGALQLLGVFTINQGGVRVDGTLGNATYLAVYMLFHVFFTLLALFKWGRNSVPLQMWYGFALILQVLMIFYAATRGTIIGLIGGLFLTGFILLIFSKGNVLFRKIGIGVVVFIFVFVIGFIGIKDTSFVKESHALQRLSSISFSELQTRLTIWHMAFEGFTERPIFGWGQEGFNYVFNKYYEPSLYAQEQWFDRAHNAFLDWLMAGGILGFILYLSLFVIALWYLIRPNPLFALLERAILAGLLAAYTINNLLVFDNLTSYIFFLVLLAYITYRSHEDVVMPQGKEVSMSLFTFASSATVVVTMLVVYFVNVPGIAVATGLLDSLKPYPEGGLSKNFEIFKGLSVYQGLGRQEVQEQLLQFGGHVLSSQSDKDFQNNVANYVVEELQKEIAQNPNDARLRVFLGSYLRQLGAFDEARTQLIQAHELSPKKQTIILEIGISYHDQGNIKEATDWFRQAYELDPAFEVPLILYAVGAIEQGNHDIVNPLLMKRYGTVTPDNDYLLQVYLSTKDYQNVIGVLKSKVAASTTDPEPHIKLSSAYLMMGDRQSAIAEIRKSIELSPSLASDGEAYIKQIEAGAMPQ